MRHGERVDYVNKAAGINWTSSAERPWDTPLTETGCDQGSAAGTRISEILREAGLEQPSAVYSSPMRRCGETISHAALNFGVESIAIEEGLVESINSDWYRSWGVPDADSTWGGPKGGPKEYEKDALDSRVFQPATELYNTAEMMNTYDNVKLPVTPRESHWTAKDQTWDNLETRPDQFSRLRSTVQALCSDHPSQTVVCCSHGGPCTHVFEELMQKSWREAGECGYAAISVYKWERDGDEWKWTLVCVNDCGHLGGKTLGGIIA
ncbi:hypothetical protein TrVE_jg5130 [Triparma verrucosa]|uniref:Phosphoglycerate mutase n=1 Tax=Triparma verrucosa TaxID=1606542 RepID=A0A9W7B6F7_9STRA|nr:hypothetical protein TrVE_jg5130 [Triparma verrucosa]